MSGTNVADPSGLMVWIQRKRNRMITMTVTVKVRPEKQKEFLQAMRSLQNDRMKAKGIRGSKVYEDEDRTSFCLTEEWETEQDLERYCYGESFRVFLGALKTLCAETELKYSMVGEVGKDRGGTQP